MLAVRHIFLQRYTKCSIEVGFNFLLDASGKLFNADTPHIQDIESNTEAIFCVMKTSRGIGRFSILVLSNALMRFYQDAKLYPAGISSDLLVIQKWALKQASALQRLVPWYCLTAFSQNETIILGKKRLSMLTGYFFLPQVSRFRRMYRMAPGGKRKKIDDLKKRLRGFVEPLLKSLGGWLYFV